MDKIGRIILFAFCSFRAFSIWGTLKAFKLHDYILIKSTIYNKGVWQLSFSGTWVHFFFANIFCLLRNCELHMQVKCAYECKPFCKVRKMSNLLWQSNNWWNFVTGHRSCREFLPETIGICFNFQSWIMIDMSQIRNA